MKKHLATLGIIVLAASIAVPVFAGRGGSKGGPGPYGSCWKAYNAGQDLTDEQKTEWETLQKDFYADTAKIRHQLWAKTDELDILLNDSEPDLKEAKSLQAEISDLRGQMAQKRLERDISAKKIAPDATLGRPHGKWRHGRRHLMRHGQGFHGWGEGHGPCWKD